MDSEIFYSGDIASSTVDGMVRRGDARRLAPGVYTTDTQSPPEEVVRRHWTDIAGHLLPMSVISDRSARAGSPVDGVLYLVHDRRDREVSLPGLQISARRGAGPQPDDVAYDPTGQLFLASTTRGVLENAEPSRRRKRDVPRRLTRHELAEWIDQICRVRGEAELNAIRDRAADLARALGASVTSVAVVDELVGTALGTREARDIPHVPHARRYGHPYDPHRTELLDHLVVALRSAAPQSRPEPPAEGVLPFFEAYFSNFIEGTEFTLDEASAIVYRNVTPSGRSADAHDIMGTYEIVADRAEMSRVPTTADELVEMLRRRHAVVMAGRPEKHPGIFKSIANQVGNTLFVAPPLVEGTLREGFARRAGLDTAWERAVLMAFLVAEVHPFDDGNGRISRIMMNAELVAGRQARIVIPTAFRSDYLGALRALSRRSDPSILVKALRYAHDWTAGIDFSDLETARGQLAATNAFEDPEHGNPLRLPSTTPGRPGEPLPGTRQDVGGDASGVHVREYVRGDGRIIRAHRRARPV